MHQSEGSQDSAPKLPPHPLLGDAEQVGKDDLDLLVKLMLLGFPWLINWLYTIDTYVDASYNFQLVMSLRAMSLGLRFCASRKGGTGGGGRVSTLGPGNMAASGLSCRKPLVSTGWAISLLLCTNGLRKRSSGHV